MHQVRTDTFFGLCEYFVDTPPKDANNSTSHYRLSSQLRKREY